MLDHAWHIAELRGLCAQTDALVGAPYAITRLRSNRPTGVGASAVYSVGRVIFDQRSPRLKGGAATDL